MTCSSAVSDTVIQGGVHCPSARLECFILEKFRVTSRNPVEKNFHVFYALFAGLSEERLAQLGLHESIESYRSV